MTTKTATPETTTDFMQEINNILDGCDSKYDEPGCFGTAAHSATDSTCLVCLCEADCSKKAESAKADEMEAIENKLAEEEAEEHRKAEEWKATCAAAETEEAADAKTAEVVADEPEMLAEETTPADEPVVVEGSILEVAEEFGKGYPRCKAAVIDATVHVLNDTPATVKELRSLIAVCWDGLYKNPNPSAKFVKELLGKLNELGLVVWDGEMKGDLRWN